MTKKALIVVDVQNDFLPGGSLSVPRGHEVIPFINRLVQLPFDIVVATCDSHPKNHLSFASQWNKRVGEHVSIDDVDQILWPDHCVQGTRGAEFSHDLDTSFFHEVFRKGTDPRIDSYSVFFDNGRKKATGLEDYLRANMCEELYFAGIATEYCVYYSIKDALALGFSCAVVVDACRGIDLVQGDIARALEELELKGVKMYQTTEVEALFSSRLLGS